MNTKHYLKLVSEAIWGEGKMPDIYYIGISSTKPLEDGTGHTEPTDPAYGRIAIPNNAANFTKPDADAVVTNTTGLFFEPTTIAGATITHYLIFDSLTGGNLLMGSELVNPRSMEIDTVISFPAGNIKLQAVNIAV